MLPELSEAHRRRMRNNGRYRYWAADTMMLDLSAPRGLSPI